jgi:hypothetical protein
VRVQISDGDNLLEIKRQYYLERFLDLRDTDIRLFSLQQNTGVTNEDFVSYVSKWCELGACLIGGCCRTTPVTIRGIYKTLYNSQSATLATK